MLTSTQVVHECLVFSDVLPLPDIGTSLLEDMLATSDLTLATNLKSVKLTVATGDLAPKHDKAAVTSQVCMRGKRCTCNVNDSCSRSLMHKLQSMRGLLVFPLQLLATCMFELCLQGAQLHSAQQRQCQ